MCGITGIHFLNTISSTDSVREVLGRMAGQLVHRGPDDSGIYVDDQVGFAHRRLSILDLETGQQPMFGGSAQTVIVFNGEIFNYIELRRELERKGHTFRTNSDTEVVIQLYEELGTEFVKRMNGQFAIAIWDRRNRRLVLARDRVGICPLYYTKRENSLIFASEIKALVPALSESLEIDPAALDQIFTFWAPVSPRTAFRGVSELSPGTMLIAEGGKERISRYWEWDSPDVEISGASLNHLADGLRDLLIDATRLRLRSDVPVGAYLSGGLDSSVLVSLIHNHSQVPLRTFSLTFDDRDYDERTFQTELIRHLGADHSSLNINNNHLTSQLIETIRHTEIPILRTAPVPMGMLSRFVRDNDFKVVLTGEGADEVLGGYDIFKESKVRQFWAKQPDSEMRPLLLKRLYPYLKMPNSGQATYLKRFFGDSLENPDLMHFSHLPRWTTTAKAKMFFADEFAASIQQSALSAMTDSLPLWLRHKSLLSRAQFIEAKSLMAGYLLCSQGDRMLMRNSVEGRFPYLDHRVIEYANRIPAKYKIRALNEKYILKKAMSSELPGGIVQRHKQPYRAPDVKAGADGRIPARLRHYVEQNTVEKAGVFSAKKVSMLTRKAETETGLNVSESQAFMGILTTQILYSTFCQ